MTKLQELTTRLEELEGYLENLSSDTPVKAFVSIGTTGKEQQFVMSDCAEEVQYATRQIVDRRIYAVKQEISFILFPPKEEPYRGEN